MGRISSKFKFDLMGFLSTIHALGKLPESNRNYLPAFFFTIFNFLYFSI